MRQNINELLSIRRLEVSLKRQDRLLLEQGISRIRQDLEQGVVFKEHVAWQAFLDKVEKDPSPPEIKSRIQELVEAILDKAGPGSFLARNKVSIWFSSPYYSEEMGERFRTHLQPFEKDLPRMDSFSLQTLLEYMNYLRASAQFSDGTSKFKTPDLLVALSAAIHYQSQQMMAPVSSALKEFLESEESSTAVITRDPSLNLETMLFQMGVGYHYAVLPGDDSGLSMVKLNGSLNWFLCGQCGRVSEAELKQSALSSVSVFCIHCGGAAHPLLGSANLPAEPFRSIMWEAYARLEESPIIFLYDPHYEETACLNDLLKYALRDYKKKVIIYSTEDTFRWWQTQFADYPAEIVKSDEDWVGFLRHQMDADAL